MLWIILLLLTALVAFVIVQPFFRAYADDGGIEETDYLAAQLLEIDRDLDAGVLTAGEAEAARQEARRRLLAQARRSDEGARLLSPMARQAGVIAAAAAPIAALALYAALGAPDFKASPPGPAAVASGAAPPAAGAPDLTQAALELRRRLDADPDDLDGWTMLGRTYATLGNFDGAAEAFGRAVALAPTTASLHAARAEALVAAAAGTVTPEASNALDQALALDAGEPRARYYKARAIYQSGDKEGALDALVALSNDSPAGAPWLNVVAEEIGSLANELGVGVESLGLSAPLQNGSVDGQAAASPEIGGGPEALEAQIAAGDAPYTAWIALVSAYRQNGETEKAADALRRAKERYEGAPFVLRELAKLEADESARRQAAQSNRPRGPTAEQARAAQAMSEDDRNEMIRGMVAGLEARLEAEPDDLEGWTMLGRSFGVLGDPGKSAAAFERAIGLDPEDIDLRIAYAQALLTQLDAAQKPIDDKTEQAVRAVLRADPDQPFALYFLGVAAQQAGNADVARANWTKLLSQLPEGSPDADRVKALIDGL